MELGGYFNLCLPVGVVLWLTEGRKRIGSRWLLMTVAMLGGLLLTFTFGAWLSLVATTGLFALFMDKKRRLKTIAAGALAFLLLVTVLAAGPLRPFIEDRVGQMAFDAAGRLARSEEHTSELHSNLNLVCRLLLEKKKNH